MWIHLPKVSLNLDAALYVKPAKGGGAVIHYADGKDFEIGADLLATGVLNSAILRSTDKDADGWLPKATKAISK